MMFKKLSIAFISLFLCSATIASEDKVVYGVDDRLDIYETTNPLFLELAKSTAALMFPRMIKENGGNLEITGATMEERGFCPVTGNGTFNYPQQITAAWCSGFLVGEDLLVTAGHCLKTEADCKKARFVFDYNISKVDQEKHILTRNSVYKCKKLEAQVLDRSTADDYAIVRLDRKVVGRRPLKFRSSGKVTDNAPLVVIGHPSGLPTKVAAGANVRKNSSSYYFVANLDTFGGNSGSAVFNAVTGLVEGILVRGANDYNFRNGCRIPNVCSMNGCRGEDVTRITNISNKINALK